MQKDDLPPAMSLQQRRLLVGFLVSLLWILGVLFTMISGLDRDQRGPAADIAWTYPFGGILAQITQITLISIGLYDLLRPTEARSSFARLGRATGITLVSILWIASSANSTERAYGGATFVYLFVLMFFLVFALVAQLVTLVLRRAISAYRTKKHAA